MLVYAVVCKSWSFLLAYFLTNFLITYAVAAPMPLPAAAPHPMMAIWRRTLALSISHSSQFSESSHPVSAMRSGPLAAVFRATISTASSVPCTAKDPLNKCEIALKGFGTIGEVHYVFNNSEKNIRGRSTQVLVSCRCLSDDCREAVLVRPVAVMKRDKDGNLSSSGKSVCLYRAVAGKFSDCHREAFRISYRQRDYGATLEPMNTHLNENGTNFEYSVSDEHHGDYWTARGNRGSKLTCLDTDVSKLPEVKLSEISVGDIDYDNNHGMAYESSPCASPVSETGAQYFRGGDEDDEEVCGKIFDHTLSSATHIASQQDCFGVGKREISFMEPRSAVLITDTELALTCSSVVLGILWLWSVFWKQLRKVKTETILLVLAVFAQIGLSYLLEALPLHTALNNEIRGRDWRSLVAFADATSSQKVRETAVGTILKMTIMLGEVEYLNTRVVLVGLTLLFDFVALVLGALILIRMSGSCRKNHQANIGSEDFTSATTTDWISNEVCNAVIAEKSRSLGGKLLRKSRSFSTSETSTHS